MSELQIGASCEKDIPALKALWKGTFGDPDALVDAFFTLLPRVGAGLVCRDGGTPVAMAYLLGGLSAGGRKCAYIYAVATDERCRGRGIGDALMKACAELAGRWGCDTLCTSPAEPSLYDWYAKTLAMGPAAFAADRFHTPGANALRLRPRPTDAETYCRRREELLAGSPHMTFSAAYLELAEQVCRACGGGLYAVGGGLACCYPEDGVLQLRELLCPPAERDSAIAALAGFHETAGVLLRGPGGEKPCAAAAPPSAFPRGFWWGLLLD